ncbi:MAG: PHB depolymerase family esterase [Eubacteriales bacterium]|nr:PHB depolymerase family esterase [Eubacteriales bacterium]
MKARFLLDIEGESHGLGDLNMMFGNTEVVEYPNISFEHPEKPFFTGLLPRTVEVNGEKRNYLVYIPEHFPISGAGIYLFPDDDVSAEEFLRNGQYIKIAEKTNAVLIVLESRPGGWRRDDIQSEMDYCEAVFKHSLTRIYYSLNEATYYTMGIGNGAYISQTFALLDPEIFAAVLQDGNYELDTSLYSQLSKIKSARDASTTKTEVEMPVWLVDESEKSTNSILNGYCIASGLQNKPLVDGNTKTYVKNMKKWFSAPDSIPIVSVKNTIKTEEQDAVQLHEEMIKWALGFKRWMGVGNGDIRPARSWEDMKLIRKVTKVDERNREWFIYEPGRYLSHKEEKLPLVIAIHGYSCTGTIFAESTQWHELAERRDFFVIYLSAFPSNQYFEGKTIPLPTWNSIGMTSEMDDIKFVRNVINEVCENYPIDEERIYVSGHSNGSLMTQRLMSEMPKRFAAFGPQGAQYHFLTNGGKPEKDIEADGVERPVWLMMGEHDVGVGDKIEPGNANDLFINMMCKVNNIDRANEEVRQNGAYTTHTWTKDQRTPLLRFTSVRDLPHTYTPEMAEMYYDTFFSHFRRKADGSIEYTL